MLFCSLTKGVIPKIGRLCVCVLINKRSFEPFMCLVIEVEITVLDLVTPSVCLSSSFFFPLLPPPPPPFTKINNNIGFLLRPTNGYSGFPIHPRGCLELELYHRHAGSTTKHASRGFSIVRNQQSATLSRQIEGSFYRLGQTLVRIEEDVIRLKHETQEGRRDISELLEDGDKAHTRLDRLEKEMEQREIASRLKNTIFFGIFEPAPGDDSRCRRTAGHVELLLVEQEVKTRRHRTNTP